MVVTRGFQGQAGTSLAKNPEQIFLTQSPLWLGKVPNHRSCKAKSTLGKCHWKNLCWRWGTGLGMLCLTHLIFYCHIITVLFFKTKSKELQKYRIVAHLNAEELQFPTQTSKFFLCQTWSTYTASWFPGNFTCSLMFMGTSSPGLSFILIAWYAFLNPKFMSLVLSP